MAFVDVLTSVCTPFASIVYGRRWLMTATYGCVNVDALTFWCAPFVSIVADGRWWLMTLSLMVCKHDGYDVLTSVCTPFDSIVYGGRRWLMTATYGCVYVDALPFLCAPFVSTALMVDDDW
jgi:hypothetical protein